ncbi:nuclear transport factor 2 family protein [Actinomadura sp. DC4]|uniref:YybH family protein n=1 Tax=Actinomadura sp. DC4 TaxID=3055069 RepID=UPI0025B25C80|nr:nuclear transport factor 2 family protein [Actinomadura sp. DC4]MDN3357396.1 nuclear transport factor 2 family protein [Actinomadura sp. DC4]
MDKEQVATWIAGYERAWRSPGTETLAEVFTKDATYLQGPFDAPLVGLPAIAEMWDEERTGPDEAFEMNSEIVAVDGDTAVARVEVTYGEPDHEEFTDLWIIRFADDGRCRSFEEWWFSPDGPA